MLSSNRRRKKPLEVPRPQSLKRGNSNAPVGLHTDANGAQVARGHKAMLAIAASRMRVNTAGAAGV